MAPPGPLPLREALLTLRRKHLPDRTHLAVTNSGDGGHRKEERAHKLPAPHAGGFSQEAGPIFVCLDDALWEEAEVTNRLLGEGLGTCTSRHSYTHPYTRNSPFTAQFSLPAMFSLDSSRCPELCSFSYLQQNFLFNHT